MAEEQYLGLGGGIPPYNAEAEQSVLGCMMTDEECVALAFENLKSDDFYQPPCKEIFRAMETLFAKDTKIDAVTVSNALSNMGSLDSVGGAAYVANLAASVLIVSNIKDYIEIIKEKSLRRKLIDAANKIAKLAYESDKTPSDIASLAQSTLSDVIQGETDGGLVHIKEVLEDSYGHLEELQARDSNITGVETGFTFFDKITSGFQKSTLNILAARPGVGKTSFALNIARNVAVKNKETVAVFSLEMGKEELVNRIWTSYAMVDSAKLKTGDLEMDDWDRLSQSLTPLSDAPIYIDDKSNTTVTEISAKCHRLKMEKNLGLVIVDYLQLMHSGGKVESRQNEVSEMSRALKIMAKELEVPVLTLSQLSRSIEQRTDKTPMLSDLRESGSIEQDADMVMFLNRKDEDKEDGNPNLVDLTIAKHRSGPTGKISLMWQPSYTNFASVDMIHEE